METRGMQTRAQIEVRGPSIDELWQVVRHGGHAPVTLELRPYFVDTAEGHCDLEEVPQGVRVTVTGPHAERRAEGLLARLRAG